MVVWVRVRIRSKMSGRSVVTSAILNTGFGSIDVAEPMPPSVRVPTSVAEVLGFWPNIPANITREDYESGGGRISLLRVPNSVEVTVLTDDRAPRTVECSLVISPIANCVLLNDSAIESLGIIVVKPASGLWKFSDEEKLRRSAKPEFWG